MDTSNLQYVTNENGETTAVVVPIEEWNGMVEELSEKKREKIKRDLKEAFEEFKAYERGEVKLLTEEEFWNALRS